MKKRFAINKHSKGRELLVLSQRGERLNTQRAKWLGDAQYNILLRFECEMGRDGERAVLHYDVRGLVSLKTYLKREVLDDAGFKRLLTSVQDVLDTCSSNRIPTELIQFDSQHVFVDNQSQPRFVVIPLDDMPFEVVNSPLAMLKALGNTRHLSFSSPLAETLSMRLEAFVLNQNNVFSANAFRAFLRDECGVGKRVVETATYCLQRLSNGESYAVSEAQQLRIGRGSQNDVRLTGNPKLSRTHALLRCVGNSVSLTDLGSANGTWVRGICLNPNLEVTIPLGQRFSLANEELVVKRG